MNSGPFDSDSVSAWISGLKKGQPDAAAKLCKRFFYQVTSIARQKLGAVPGACRDEEDVALSALNDIFVGAQEGRFSHLENRIDFWQIILMILSRKVANHRRASAVRKETVVADMTNFDGQQDPAKFLEEIAFAVNHEYGLDSLGIECEELLSMLDDRLRRIALLKMAGLTNVEIAASQNKSVSTIERSLQSIRNAWADVVWP